MGRERDDRPEQALAVKKARQAAPPRIALTIAGLDPSGGAGLTADLRGFRAAGVWGATACAVVTVQSTCGLVSAHPIAAAVVRAQVTCVLADMDVRAMKVGALGSEENARAVAELLAEHREIPAIVDPVMAPSRALESGARLDGRASHEALWALVRASTLVTPNADEASALLGRAVHTPEEGRAAAEDVVRAGARAALVKGGHLGGERAIDWLATARGVVAIERKRRVVPALHGTGCTLSSLITGKLARRRERGPVTDEELVAAVRWARLALDRALRAPVAVGSGARVLEVAR